MRVAVYDLETFNLNANDGALLCASILDLKTGKVKTFRADHYPGWKKGRRSDDAALVKDVIDYLVDNFDILVAHNGEGFDRRYLLTKAVRYGFRSEAMALRRFKTVDPVILARRYLRLARNSLVAIIDYLGVKTQKTPIHFNLWVRAFGDGDRKALGYIVAHCIADVKALGEVYEKLTPIIEKVDSRGSHG